MHFTLISWDNFSVFHKVNGWMQKKAMKVRLEWNIFGQISIHFILSVCSKKTIKWAIKDDYKIVSYLMFPTQNTFQFGDVLVSSFLLFPTKQRENKWQNRLHLWFYKIHLISLNPGHTFSIYEFELVLVHRPSNEVLRGFYGPVIEILAVRVFYPSAYCHFLK